MGDVCDARRSDLGNGAGPALSTREHIRGVDVDIAAARQAIEGDLLYKLRDDRNPLPSGAAPL